MWKVLNATVRSLNIFCKQTKNNQFWGKKWHDECDVLEILSWVLVCIINGIHHDEGYGYDSKEIGIQLKHARYVTQRGRQEQNKFMNKRLTQDFFVGGKKSITSQNREVRQRVNSKVWRTLLFLFLHHHHVRMKFKLTKQRVE